MLQRLDTSLLGDLDEVKDEQSELIKEEMSPLLAQIEEDEEDEINLDEADRCIRVSNNGKTVELISPALKGVLKIRNPKVPIASNALRFQELVHIENTIVGMQAMPDFGYEGDNFVIERSTDAPRNWKLLTDFVYNKDKYEWLQNHLTLRKLRQQQLEEDERKRLHLMNRKQ